MNNRREFLVAIGALAGSHVLQLFPHNLHMDKLSVKNKLLFDLNQTWQKNQNITVNQYISTNNIVAMNDEDLKAVIRTDFSIENTIFHDGFIFSLTEFAIVISYLNR